MNTTEIECRFIGIDKEKLVKKLLELGAVDKGEKLLDEVMFYDQDLKWRIDQRFIRIRKAGDVVTISYKEHQNHTVDGTYEIELHVDDFEKSQLLFQKIGLRLFRRQQKLRHTFILGEATFDIDTWPKIPPYVEIEGNSEDILKEAANKVGFDWKDANFNNPGWIIINTYHIPVNDFTWFTFDRQE